MDHSTFKRTKLAEAYCDNLQGAYALEDDGFAEWFKHTKSS